jgi:outer membrane protein assembly factor BamA
MQGYNMTQFYYGQLENVFYDPYLSQFIDRDLATATRTIQGGTAFGIYPFNRYRRVELYGGFSRYQERFNDPLVEAESNNYQQQQFGRQLFNNGNMMPLGAAFVQETTIFREFGPLSGSTMRLAYEFAPGVGSLLSRQTFDGDARKYFRLGANGLLALRARGFKSKGDNPDFTYFGGNSELRGYDYLSFIGQNAFFANAELRFPLIEAMATPIGVLGGVRATLFAGMGGAYFDGQPFKFYRKDTTLERPIIGYDNTNGEVNYGTAVPISGLRLQDGRASYGISLATFALGFPVHFDWSWRTLLNKDYEDVLFHLQGGSAEFRKPKFSMWIGYDW